MNEINLLVGELPTPVVAALRRVLKPLIRLLLSYGFQYQTFCDLVKWTYIHVAEEEFKLDKKNQTDSRISLLTGVHRRDIHRLRKESSPENTLPLHSSMSAKLLAIWSGNEKYTDSHGIPLPLPRSASKGGDHSFEGLVSSVSKDFRARVVLDDWVNQGIATIDEDDNVHLVADAFAAPKGIEEKSFYFGQNIHDHLAATVKNLSSGTPPFMERCVYYSNLTAESVKEHERVARLSGMKALHLVNRHAVGLKKQDAGKPDAIYRANFGIYNYSEINRGEGSHENK